MCVTITRLHRHVCQHQFGEASTGGMITGEITLVVLKWKIRRMLLSALRVAAATPMVLSYYAFLNLSICS